MERDLPEAPDAVPLQTAGLLHRLEHPLDGLALGVEVLPFLALAPDHTEEPDVLGGVLPNFRIAMQDPSAH